MFLQGAVYQFDVKNYYLHYNTPTCKYQLTFVTSNLSEKYILLNAVERGILIGS